ncbi:hypothetical protein H4R35_002540 [Dimargaris xerosporica]|nr:hypothetical protein H4R35_002540 [Dimargaris xerosporica]
MRLFVDHAQYRAVTVLFQTLRDHNTWPEYPLSSAVIVSFLQLSQRTKALYWYRQFIRRGIMVDAHVVDQLDGQVEAWRKLTRRTRPLSLSTFIRQWAS